VSKINFTGLEIFSVTIEAVNKKEFLFLSKIFLITGLKLMTNVAGSGCPLVVSTSKVLFAPALVYHFGHH